MLGILFSFLLNNLSYKAPFFFLFAIIVLLLYLPTHYNSDKIILQNYLKTRNDRETANKITASLFKDDNKSLGHYLVEFPSFKITNYSLDFDLTSIVTTIPILFTNEKKQNQSLLETSLFDNQSIDVHLQLNAIE